MKTIVKFILCVLFSIFMATPESVNASLSPFGMNASLDPSKGTAAAADIFQDVASIEEFGLNASEFVSPAWLEILVLVSPASFPISTFLTQKTLDGIRGLAKAQKPTTGTYEDYFIKTADGSSRFNPQYRVQEDNMKNASEFGETQINNYKLNWGQIAVIPYQDSLSATYTQPGPATTTAVLHVNNAQIWTAHMEVKVQNATYADGQPLTLLITAVDTSAGTITVASLGGASGTTVIPTINTGTRVTRMGTAFGSMDVKNTMVAQYPTSDYNYAQKFITSVVYSNWSMMTSLFTNYSFSMITNLALQDFRYGQEFSFMFGPRCEKTVTIGGESKVIHTTGGLEHFIDQVIEYGTGGGNTTITETDIVDFTKQMRIGNNGSDTRFWFAGSDNIAALNKGVMSDRTRFVQKEYDTIYGLSFTVLYSFFGTINVMYAPLMDQSEYINKAFLLDMQFVDKFVFQPFKETKVNLVALRQADAQSVDMLEACGLIIRNLDCHFIVNVAA
jgi:hypothetical protein